MTTHGGNHPFGDGPGLGGGTSLSGTTLHGAHADHARKVADAILYEGYLLYPYRASSRKNRARFQFGVLMPSAYRAVDDSERSSCQTECLLECPDDAHVEVMVRFLWLRRRTVLACSTVPADDGGELRQVESLTVDGTTYTCFDEAEEREELVTAPVSRLLDSDTVHAFRCPGGEESTDLVDAGGRRVGALVRRWTDLDGAVEVHAERVAGPYRALRLRVRVRNLTVPDRPPRDRDGGLAHALIAAHALIGVDGGTFLSMTDPPEWAAAEVAACANVGTWPVLAGPAECGDLMLSAPVILYDHPEVAQESNGDLFDATEIDEILTLRTIALTDEEKREARATDPRAAELIDRLDDLPQEMLDKLHGAIRYLGPTRGSGASAAADPAPFGAAGGPGASGGTVPPFGAPGDGVPTFGTPGDAVPMLGPPPPGAVADAVAEAAAGGRPAVPWWDPGSDASVSPETDRVQVAEVSVGRGSRVWMRPGARRADAQDLFLAGREAVVEAVLFDVDGHAHLAVSPVGDPAAELQRGHGRFLYFAPDELEPIAEGSPAPAGGEDESDAGDGLAPNHKEETT